MEPKDALRVQQSFLSGPEKRFLEGCARRLPTKILPDHLTWFGFVGSLMAGSAYVLTNWSKAY
ncbi:MAG: CDP-alcohol phosphatidyltransferase, partial [Spirochaetales bacterium]